MHTYGISLTVMIETAVVWMGTKDYWVVFVKKVTIGQTLNIRNCVGPTKVLPMNRLRPHLTRKGASSPPRTIWILEFSVDPTNFYSSLWEIPSYQSSCWSWMSSGLEDLTFPLSMTYLLFCSQRPAGRVRKSDLSCSTTSRSSPSPSATWRRRWAARLSSPASSTISANTGWVAHSTFIVGSYFHFVKVFLSIYTIFHRY